MTGNIQTVTLRGQRFVILPEADYRELVGERRAVGLTQADLAKRAGVRVETLSRLEHAKHSPNVATVDRIVRSLEQAEAERPARPAARSRSQNTNTGPKGDKTPIFFSPISFPQNGSRQRFAQASISTADYADGRG